MTGITSLQLLNDEAGRWGNQLFRIATMIGYSKLHGVNFYVANEWKHSKLFENNYEWKNYSSFVNSIKEKFEERGFHYQNLPKSNGILELSGYFQSYKYFENATSELFSFFKFRSDLVKEVKEKYFKEDKVRLSVHVRHGDFFDRTRKGGHVGNEHYHPVMSLQFYKNSISHILSKTKIDEILIFTDHPETKKFVEGYFEEFGISIKYMDYQDEFIYDFITQTLCNHAIIPNSTFSWWSAYLNNNPEKIICSPTEKDWFGPGYSHYIMTDLLPKSWIKINQ